MAELHPQYEALLREYERRHEANTAAKQQPKRPEQPRVASPMQYVPRTEMLSKAQSKPERDKRHLSPKTRRMLGLIGVGAVVSVSLAYGTNIAGARDTVNSALGHRSEAGGSPSFGVGESKQYSTHSLAPDQCTDPEATLAVAKYSGYMPLALNVPTDADPKTAITVSPYMTKEKFSHLSSANEKKMDAFVTESGYPQATLVDMPMAIQVCTRTDSSGNTLNAVDEYGHVNRSNLKITFEDGTLLYPGSGYNIVYQNNGYTHIDADPSKAEYMTLPNPYLNKPQTLNANGQVDATADKATDVVLEALGSSNPSTAAQTEMHLAIAALMETSITQQVNSEFSHIDHKEYPGGRNDLMSVIDAGIYTRLTGDNNPTQQKMKDMFFGDYAVGTNTPVNPSTAQPIISSADPLPGIDEEKAVVKVTDVKITYGPLEKPQTRLTPTPTPTESTATTKP